MNSDKGLQYKISQLFKNSNIDSLSVSEIAEWVSTDEETKSKLRLPPIQRSLVWTNEQIINFWDSLLRGYPGGLMMVYPVLVSANDLENKGRDINGNTKSMHQGDFQLFDGQQRLSAILLGLGKGQLALDRKLWIDFAAPTSSSGLRFQLRISSIGQPFGYNKDYPNQKIELKKRKEKWADTKFKDLTHKDVFKKVEPTDLIDAQHAFSFAEACDHMLRNSAQELHKKYGEHGVLKDCVTDFLDQLKVALSESIVLRKLDEQITNNPEEYIRYFGRVGQGGTRLSDDELTYSILKYQQPGIHDQMKSIMEKTGRIADEVDLVMASIRVAKTLQPWDAKHAWEIIARPTPSTIKTLTEHNATYQRFLELIPCNIDQNTHGELAHALNELRAILQYSPSAQNGFPTMLLARFPKELIDVLLLIVVKNKLDDEGKDLLRTFTLYWLLFVSNTPKSAWQFFESVRQKSDWHFSLSHIRELIQIFEKQGWAHQIPSELELDSLKKKLQYPDELLQSWSERFRNVDEGNRKPGQTLRIITTNQELIKRCLMWLQRTYFADKFSHFDPTSQVDEDLPVDLDHLIPQCNFAFHWGNENAHFTDVINENDRKKIKENFWQNRNLIGNSLGNYRWLDAQENRSRQDGKIVAQISDSISNVDSWNKLITSDNHIWSHEDMNTFQGLIEKRALQLFESILIDGKIYQLRTEP